MAAFDHTDPDLPVEERVALGMKRCGFSITCEKPNHVPPCPLPPIRDFRTDSDANAALVVRVCHLECAFTVASHES